MKRTILDRIRDIINPPYLIDDSPEIKVYNPKVELVDIDEYRFKIITSKNSNTNIEDIINVYGEMLSDMGHHG